MGPLHLGRLNTCPKLYWVELAMDRQFLLKMQILKPIFSFIFVILFIMMSSCACDKGTREFEDVCNRNESSCSEQDEDISIDQTSQKNINATTKKYPHLTNIKVVEDATRIKRKAVAPLRSLEELPEICTKTGGKWHHNLQSCRCEQNKLFAPLWGCASIEVSSKGMNCLKNGMENILTQQGDKAFLGCLSGMFPEKAYLSFDIDNWTRTSSESRAILARTLDKSAFDFLSNENDLKFFEYSHHYLLNSKGFTRLIITSTTRFNDAILLDLPEDPLFDIRKQFLTFSVQETSTASFESACEYHVNENFPNSNRSKFFCSDISDWLSIIRGDSKIEFQSYYDRENCTLCGKSIVNRAKNSNYQYRTSFTTVFKNFYPTERVVSIESDDLSLVLNLDAKGGILSSKLNVVHFLDERNSGYLRISKEIKTDRNLELLSKNERQDTKLEDLWNFLKIKKQNLSSDLSKDLQIRILMIDDMLNLTNDRVSDQVYINPLALQDLPDVFDDQIFREFLNSTPIFEESRADSIIEGSLLPLRFGIFSAFQSKVTHAQRMAEVIVHQLKNIKLFLGGYKHRYRMSPNAFVSFLKKNRIDIVTCTVLDLHRDSDYFSKIASQAPEVIFVVSAGNYDVDNYIAEPAWSLLNGNFPNIVVPTEYRSTHLKRKVIGNGGLGASIAVNLADSGDGTSQFSDNLMCKSGTSCAASRLTNFIAKLRMLYPAHSSSELISMIHRNVVSVQGLSARNSGYVNFNLDVY